MLSRISSSTSSATAPGSPAPAASAMSRHAYAALVQRAEGVFRVMRPIVEDTQSRLQHYRNDFYQHDRHYLRTTHAVGQYLWLVRESGTDLRQLGVHASEHDWARAALTITQRSDIYLVNADTMTLSRVNNQQAAQLLDAPLRYRLDDDVITKNGEPLARLAMTTHWDGQHEVDAVLESLRVLDDAERATLGRFIGFEGAARTGSMFTAVRRATLDGHDLFTMLGPPTPALDASATWYGVIRAAADEADFLRSLRIDLGAWNATLGTFSARVTEAALANLEPYAGSIDWELRPLPHALKPEGEIELVKPLARLTVDQLTAYDAFLRYAASVDTSVPAPVFAAMIDATGAESKRRAAPAATATALGPINVPSFF
ncbi:hypothetical protein [Burkholderia vietnamiensis]|uniref:hypothetical protein n=1 Tax=Burkholderia vietnamiensis TaxID=60552 RepID=UPI001CF2F424|nr:hypothetical protein [Burkholderia vietnamiensis]MCA8228375.1 hypothetical protein [Burkholderia vietnamiensis]